MRYESGLVVISQCSARRRNRSSEPLQQFSRATRDSLIREGIDQGGSICDCPCPGQHIHRRYLRDPDAQS